MWKNAFLAKRTPGVKCFLAEKKTCQEHRLDVNTLFPRRGDRAAEGARLEIVCTLTGTESSNLSLSATAT